MRTTLSLDRDVSVQIEALRQERAISLKELVNEGLRRGLAAMAKPNSLPRNSIRTPEADLGKCLLASVDDVTEALAVAEGEKFR